MVGSSQGVNNQHSALKQHDETGKNLKHERQRRKLDGFSILRFRLSLALQRFFVAGTTLFQGLNADC
jgi:hypothetical protein